MKKSLRYILLIIFTLLATHLFAETKVTRTYKSAVSFIDEKNSDKRYEVIIESKGEVRYLLCKDYKTASDCYYAIALYGQTEMNTDLTEKIPNVLDSLKRQ
ncbi:MAG: hypothetical protein IK021_01255 [Methanobrevibacter sp.]|nr:hypothetical protein [Methanobrevibacter sp.]